MKFKTFTDWLFGTKIVFSLPIMTEDRVVNMRIMDLKEGLKEIAEHFHEKFPPQPSSHKKVWVNANTNFAKYGTRTTQYYAADGTHLSNRGKAVILGNFRHQIHHITRIVQGKPPKSKVVQPRSAVRRFTANELSSR